MANTKVGLVTYEGETAPCRVIFPTRDDNEILNDLCPCGCGELHWKAHLKRGVPTIRVVDRESPEAVVKEWAPA